MACPGTSRYLQVSAVLFLVFQLYPSRQEGIKIKRKNKRKKKKKQ
jgi:hypothetical protein